MGWWHFEKLGCLICKIACKGMEGSYTEKRSRKFLSIANLPPTSECYCINVHLQGSGSESYGMGILIWSPTLPCGCMEYNILHAAITGKAKVSTVHLLLCLPCKVWGCAQDHKMTTLPFNMAIQVVIRLCSLFHTPDAFVVWKDIRWRTLTKHTVAFSKM